MSDSQPLEDALAVATPSPPLPWIFEFAAVVERVDTESFYTDPGTMDRTLRNTLDLFDVDVAVAPFDTSLEAEALGCETVKTEGRPEVVSGIVASVDDAFDLPITDVRDRGRVPTATEAVGRLVDNLTDESVVSGITGPQTLTNHLLDPAADQETLTETQWTAGDVIVEIARGYFDAGADAIALIEPALPSTPAEEAEYVDALEPVVNVAAHYDRRAVFLTERLTTELVETVADVGFDAVIGEPDAEVEAAVDELEESVSVGFGVPQSAFVDGPDTLLEYRDAAASCTFSSSQLQIPVETTIESMHAFLDEF